jgi:RNA polymerase sigma factor (sigma-70 family)
MDDREAVASIAAGDLAGLADAYDRYAESAYGYCHWMLHEPAEADEALLDTFVIAAGRMGGLRDPRKLRPWLYAVARNECHRRLRGTQVGLDEAADVADPAADHGPQAERGAVRRLVRAALSGLNPGEREALELDLRHDLHGADLAAVLGVSRHHAHALASHARGQLEKSLGAMLVTRTGRRACPNLAMMLSTWDGRLTVFARKRISRHIDQCETCDDRRRDTLRPATLIGMAPLAALPLALRHETLRLCADDSDEAVDYRRAVTLAADPFGPNGFPAAIRQRRGRLITLARIAGAAGVLTAVVSTGIITALALGGSHAPHPHAAAQASGGSGTASATGSSGAPATPGAPGSSGAPGASAGAGPPASASQAATTPVTTAQPSSAVPSTSSVQAKPSPSHTTRTSASATPTPTPSTSAPTPTPTPTLTVSPTASPTFP